MKIKTLLILFFLIQIGFSQNQSELLYNYFNALQKIEFKNANKIAEKELNSKTKTLLILLSKIIEDDRQTELFKLDSRFNSIDTTNANIHQKFIVNIILGFKNLNYYPKNRSQSFLNFKKAYDISIKINNLQLKKYALFYLIKFYLRGALQANDNYDFYLQEYKSLSANTIDWLYYYDFKFNLIGQTEIYDETNSETNKESKILFKKYDSIAKILKEPTKQPFLSNYYTDYANFVVREKPNLAKKYYIKAFNNYTNSNYFKFQRFYHFINLSRVASLNKNYKKGIDYLNQAKQYISYNDSLWDKHDISFYKALLYNHLKQYDSAYFYEKEVRILGYEINFQEENQKVAELKVKLNTAEKEKENLQLKQDKERDKYILIAAFLTIIAGSIIYLLSYKNSIRKRKLAEQQKELETQKNLTLLKEQEITTINAMVDGQEKERKRIAEDLHDNLGSVLATLKLHFENLKINREKKKINQEELFNKTETLIDEAYLKVRRIAHAKNAGVIANQGLLLAVQMMAEKISSADKINIEVIHFGLNKRLKNHLELTVFRIIQELVTNIIKHAEAKNATINLSLYEKNLNIIIEDDGKGFDINKVDLSSGMGISSIKTRAEHLNGTFNIDATLGKGSSIILDIPIT